MGSMVGPRAGAGAGAGVGSQQAAALVAWVGQDRLRPTHLRATLTRLLDRERDEWEPCTFTFTSPTQGEEVDMVGRDAAVRWQGEACGRLGWGSETKFAAAALLDRLLHRVRIPPRYLHAVAAAAVFLAAKIHEEDENVPPTVEVVDCGGMRCSARELLRMERVLLDKLAWGLQATSVLDFLQVLHALAIITAPKHHHAHRSGSPTRQLECLTDQLWHLVGSGRSGRVRPSLLALALLSLELDAAAPEPGLTLWLQALTQVSDEELSRAQELVRELLGMEARPTPRVPAPVPASRPNKRKVDQAQEPQEEDMYSDIKKLYAYDKMAHTSPVKHASDGQLEDLDEPYTDIRRLYSSPAPPIAPPRKGPGARKRKRTKPTFKAKTAVKSCLKQALKIPCKISLIATKKIFEEPVEEEEEEEEDEEEEEAGMEVEEGWEGPLVEPVGLINSPIFSPMSPEFPDIRHLVMRKEDMSWDQQAQAVAEQVYRPMTYAQVLRLHLTPLTRALGV